MDNRLKSTEKHYFDNKFLLTPPRSNFTKYNGVQISWQRVFWAGNQGNHQNQEPKNNNFLLTLPRSNFTK